MKKKINLLILFLVMLIISSFSVTATLFHFYGNVSLDSNNTPDRAPIDVYIDYVKDAKVYVGDNNANLPQRYVMNFEANTGQVVYFQVWGCNATQGEITLILSDSSPGRNLNLTANKSADDAACRYSYGCTNGYCCSGATEYTDGSGTGTCQSSACSSGSSSTTGGGGGGGAVATTATSESIDTGRVNGGQTASAIFTVEDLGVTGVDITVIKTVTASSVSVINMGDSKGIATKATTSDEDAANIDTHAYLKITVGKIANANMEKAVIKFKVKKSAGYDPGTIELRRYDGVNKIWSSLTTTLVLQDTTYYYYEAETPGFSIFAIVGKKVAMTMMELLDMIRTFYGGTSPYTMMEILDQIRTFYGG